MQIYLKCDKEANQMNQPRNQKGLPSGRKNGAEGLLFFIIKHAELFALSM